MKPIREQIQEKPWLAWTLFLATVVVVFLLGLLASSVLERRTEATFAYTPEVAPSQFDPRNDVWGEYFPREYNSYMQTKDTSLRTKYGGSAVIDMLEEDPRMVVLWAGYGFSKDYTQGRGHYYAIQDIHESLRTGAPVDGRSSPMPNTCWTCKSSDVPRVMNNLIEKHDGDVQAGVAEFYSGSWEERGHQIVNIIGCADCHDAETMNLRISRPALIEAFQNTGRDINDATHQEMRSLTCAQCHVEYYFNTNIVEGSPYLKFPWDNGMSVDSIEVYYDNIEFTDWTHQISRAPMLKAQHPGYEIWQTGTHASRGVSCADCHMPYINERGQKFSDHRMVSPLSDVSRSCQVCHREDTERLVQDVYTRQDKIYEIRVELEKLLVRAHVEAGKAWELGATENQMEGILMDIRHAQWRWDFGVAAHGASFHSPLEVGRMMGVALSQVQDARIKLARLLASLGFNEEVPYPDIETKAKAQQFVGLPMEKLREEKEEFMTKLVPEWLEIAEKREASY